MPLIRGSSALLMAAMLTSTVVVGCAASSGTSALSAAPASDTAVVFAPGVVSTGDVFASTFTPDGRTVVFTKFAPPRTMSLMTSTLVEGRWTTPTVLPFSGAYRDLDPAFTPDGSRLYFSSWRPSGPSAADTTTAADTWYVDRIADGWSMPIRLPAPVNSADVDMFPSVTKRGVLYFDSFRSRPSKRFVYRAEPRADGTLREPELVSAAVNSDSGASNLFVDPDERYVVFGAARPEGRGALDLYISWRSGTAWSPAVNLGRNINTAATEFCPFVSRDGRFLYFTRVTTFPDQRVERNIYVVPFDARQYSTR